MVETYTINTTVSLVTGECYKCHTIFAMTKDHHERAKANGDTFYCPNGHPQVYSRTEVAKLKQQLDQKEVDLQWANTRLSGALQEIAHKKRALTGLQKRIENGVCPQCHRHFTNLERHMKSQH